jgi:hypothetical protein
MARNVKPSYRIRRVDNGDVIEGPWPGALHAEERADQLAGLMGVQLFVQHKMVYGSLHVSYTTGYKKVIIDLKAQDYEVVR